MFEHLFTWRFWRNQAVCFCVFSVVGHWLEILYCLFMDHFFGIVDPDSLVWDDFMYPFMVYGFAAVICAVLFAPLRDFLLSRQAGTTSGTVIAAGQFYAISVLGSMLMELTQGFIQNRPDENGVYPLWDNSHLPLNILGQAWLVNDIILGVILTFYVWCVLPFVERCFSHVPSPAANAVAAAVVVAFAVLCVMKFSA